MGESSSFLLSSPEAIEGIGPQRAAALREAGITTIAAMFRAGAPRVHALCPGAGTREVGEWFCKAVLLRVRGLTHDLADALVRAGVRTVQKLAEANLADLETAVRDAQADGRLRQPPDVYGLARLQQAAWRLADVGMLAGRLRHRNGAPVRNALVDIGEQETRTDEDGWFAFEKVRAGRTTVRVEMDGRPLPLELRPSWVRAAKLTPLVLRVDPAPPGDPLPVIHEIDGQLIANTPGTRVQLVWRELAEMPDGAILQVRHVGSDGAVRLLSYFKERIGRTIFIPRARVRSGDLPSGAKVGDMLRYTGGHLEASGLTRLQVAELKRERWKAAARHSSRHGRRIRR